LGEYERLMDTIVIAIETLSKKQNAIAPEATRCYIPLFDFEHRELSKQTAAAFLRTIKVYVSMPASYDLQGAASVVTSVFPKLCQRADDDEFGLWLIIIDHFATFQHDKPFLPVSTHATLNMLLSLPRLEEKRLLLIVQHLMQYIEVKHPPLTTKSFEIICELNTCGFDDKGRSRALQILLPMIQKMLDTKECFDCFEQLIGSDLAMDIIVTDDQTARRLIEIARRSAHFKVQLSTMLSAHMNLLNPTVFGSFLSLGRELQSVYLSYFQLFCRVGSQEVEFALRVKDAVKNSIMAVISLMIDEDVLLVQF
jgi:hypothetical protein